MAARLRGQAFSNNPRVRDPRIVIVGAGMSGICLGATLKRAGFENFVIYDKAKSVGGTWRDNVYPGLTCDVASHAYQYSFDLNPEWNRLFSPGEEIGNYFRGAIDRQGLRSFLRLGREVIHSQHDGGRWHITFDDGEIVDADFIVFATGVLHHPSYPDIPGCDDFAGPIFHSARWDREFDYVGKRVAVIGNGSTGVQIVAALAGVADRTLMFQRSPQWILKLPNPHYSKWVKKALGRSIFLHRKYYTAFGVAAKFVSRAMTKPGISRKFLQGVIRRNLRTIREESLRAALTPDYQPLCRRLIVHPNFYEKIQRPDVELITAHIDFIEERGVVTSDGVLHEVDGIVLATGFKAHAYLRPISVAAADGHTLDQAWANGPKAYRSVTVPGFDNMFLMMGPNSPIGNFSLVPIAEEQANYALRWIERWAQGEYESVSPTAQALDEYKALLDAGLPGTVWTSGCTSWYFGPDGKPELWPYSPFDYFDLLNKPDEERNITLKFVDSVTQR